jgi:ATP-dependent 26S proteasome regulatory subunit
MWRLSCRLRLLKLERVKDYLLMEEFVAAQERLRPQENKAEEDHSKVDDLRSTPMSVRSLEEIIDESHAIVSSVDPSTTSASSPSLTRTSSCQDAPSSYTTRSVPALFLTVQIEGCSAVYHH